MELTGWLGLFVLSHSGVAIARHKRGAHKGPQVACALGVQHFLVPAEADHNPPWVHGCSNAPAACTWRCVPCHNDKSTTEDTALRPRQDVLSVVQGAVVVNNAGDLTVL